MKEKEWLAYLGMDPYDPERYKLDLLNLNEVYFYSLTVRPTQSAGFAWRAIRQNKSHPGAEILGFPYTDPAMSLLNTALGMNSATLNVPSLDSMQPGYYHDREEFLEVLQVWLPPLPHLAMFLALSELVHEVHEEVASTSAPEEPDLTIFKPAMPLVAVDRTTVIQLEQANLQARINAHQQQLGFSV